MMGRALCSVLLLLALYTQALATPAVLQLDTGPMLRNDDGVYKGIPYAAPPVAALRWRPPQPVPAWTEPRTFGGFGPACPQAEADDDSSEDCLTLNVWTPAGQDTTRAPVMVFIHGGAFLSGAGSLATYDGAALAENGVVVVTLNYRLGALGFMAHPLLSLESPQGVSGNYGLLDQQAALAWVRRNIAAFGGDPNTVTVFGQSAGGASIVLQLVSPAAANLFDRAIVQSPVGPGALRPLQTSAPGLLSAEAVGLLLARQLGAQGADDVLAALRRADTDAVLAATSALPAETFLEVAGIVFGPVVDGVVVPGHPVERIRAGQQHPKPLLIGTVRDEATLFLPGLTPPADTQGAYNRLIEARFGVAAGAVLALAPGQAQAGLWNQLNRLITRRWFTTYARFLAYQWAASGTPCFLYHFARPLPDGALSILAEEGGVEEMDMELLGVPHGADIFTAFGFTPWYLGFDDADRDFSKRLQTSWAGFAATGQPGGSGLPVWPQFDPGAPAAMEFAEATAVRQAPDDPLDRLVEAGWMTTMY